MKPLYVLVTFVAVLAPTSLRADIFQWEYIDPLDPALGRQQSSVLTPDGAGQDASPGANLQTLDLTRAWLRHVDLTDVDFYLTTLNEADLSGANLTRAWFVDGSLTDAVFTGASIQDATFAANLSENQLYSTAGYQARSLVGLEIFRTDMRGWDLSGMDLTNATLGLCELDNANFDEAIIRNADFTTLNRVSLTPEQLYSTASYRSGDLRGVRFTGNDLRGFSFVGQDLTGAYFRHGIMGFGSADLRDADFENAVIHGAEFSGWGEGGFTLEQLYSTASYRSRDLSHMILSGVDLRGADFVQQNLLRTQLISSTIEGADFTNANLQASDVSDWRGDDPLSPPNLTGMDLRGAAAASLSSAANQNLIYVNGRVEGLHVGVGEMQRLWDLDPTLTRRYSGQTIGDIPIYVEDMMSIDPAGTLRVVFEDGEWGSTLTFESGIPVTLDGTLELLFDDDVNPQSLVGTTYQLFDWTGVSPSGAFDAVAFDSGTRWDTSSLYASGEVTLIGAVPEPTTLFVALLGLAGAVSCISRTQR